jgi:hypothetical protein
MKKIRALFGACTLTLGSFSIAYGAVSADQAALLKTTLTPFGAEKGASSDGNIPAWTGGYTQVPAGYRSGDPLPNLFAGDNKLYSITAANMNQYKDKLAEGAQYLLKKYPDFRIDVYPTRRTAAAPQWVYDNTFANATRAQTTNGGLSVTGAYGGVPFPIPQDGYQVMWNHLLAWKGENIQGAGVGYVLTNQGQLVLSSVVQRQVAFPYFQKSGSLASFNGSYQYATSVTVDPPYQRGQATLVKIPLDQYNSPISSWQYLTGQRRVRKAPDLAYDTPNFFSSGVINFDEFGVFYGAMDRYDVKLIGKKEILIPYNMNNVWTMPLKSQIGSHFHSPDATRWELHRVWEVEFTLASGKRNIIAKRDIYVDEDSWNAVLADEWDGSGNLWKFLCGLPAVLPELPGVLVNNVANYDFQSGMMAVTPGVSSDYPTMWKSVAPLPETAWTPQALAAAGVE